MIKLIAAALITFCLISIAGESKAVTSAEAILGKWSSVRYKNDVDAILAIVSNTHSKYYPGNVKGFDYTFSKDSTFQEVKTFADGQKETTKGTYKIERGILHLITVTDEKNNAPATVKHKVELSGGYLMMHRKHKENGGVREFVTTFQPENIELGSDYTLTLYVEPTHTIGEPLNVTVTMKNISKRAISYDSIGADNGSSFQLVGPDNKPVVPTWGWASTETNQRSLGPGRIVNIVNDYELASSDFLIDRAGRYTVRFRYKLPIFNKRHIVESNIAHFQVTPGKSPNVDRLARQLVAKVPKGLRLVKIGRSSDHRKPDGWSSAPCDLIFFVNPMPPEYITALWQTSKKLEPADTKDRKAASIYLGQGDYGHLYFESNKKIREAWPTVVEDLKNLLIRK